MASAIFRCSHPGARRFSSSALWTFGPRSTSFRPHCENRRWPLRCVFGEGNMWKSLGATLGLYGASIPYYFPPILCDQFLHLIGRMRACVVMMKWDLLRQHSWTFVLDGAAKLLLCLPVSFHIDSGSFHTINKPQHIITIGELNS